MIAGAIRVKNGARWMEESLSATLRVCDRIVVMDNNSTDDTVDICREFAPRVIVIPAAHNFLNEAGDKNVLVAKTKELLKPTWIVMPDADEIILDPEALLANIYSGKACAYKLHILSCWDTPQQVRMDGIYGKCWRSSCFQANASDGIWIERSPVGPNLHCGSVPSDVSGRSGYTIPGVRVRHYGYMLREDRIRKYHWYIESDPNGMHLRAEDFYRHSVIGDLPEFPAESVFKHGGPLKLEPFPA